MAGGGRNYSTEVLGARTGVQELYTETEDANRLNKSVAEIQGIVVLVN